MGQRETASANAHVSTLFVLALAAAAGAPIALVGGGLATVLAGVAQTDPPRSASSTQEVGARASAASGTWTRLRRLLAPAEQSSEAQRVESPSYTLADIRDGSRHPHNPARVAFRQAHELSMKDRRALALMDLFDHEVEGSTHLGGLSIVERGNLAERLRRLPEGHAWEILQRARRGEATLPASDLVHAAVIAHSWQRTKAPEALEMVPVGPPGAPKTRDRKRWLVAATEILGAEITDWKRFELSDYAYVRLPSDVPVLRPVTVKDAALVRRLRKLELARQSTRAERDFELFEAALNLPRF